MTLDDKFDFSQKFAVFRRFENWEPATAKRMKIDAYSQRRYCSQLNVLFSSVYITSIKIT